MQIGNALMSLAAVLVVGCEAALAQGPVPLYGGPTLVTDSDQGSQPSFPGTPIRFGSRVAYSALAPGAGRELFVAQAVPNGSATFLDLEPGSVASNPLPLLDMGDWLLVSAFDNPLGLPFNPFGKRLVFRCDAVTLNTTPLDPWAGALGYCDGPAARLGARAYFFARFQQKTELWALGENGDASSLSKVFTFESVDSSGELTEFDGRLWFVRSAPSTGFELWSSDGSTAGTVLHDIVSGSVSSFPRDLTVAGGKLYFVANVNAAGQPRLFTVSAGQQPQQGPLLSATSTSRLMALDGGVLIVNNVGIYWSNGTGQNPTVVQLLGGAISGMLPLATAGQYCYLSGFLSGAEHSYRCRRLPGSLENLGPWAVDPSGAGAVGGPTVAIGDRVLQREFSPGAGWEFGVRESGPYQLAADIGPGAASSAQPLYIVGLDIYGFYPWAARVGNQWCVLGDDGSTGLELHALPITSLGGFVLEPFGHTCGQSRISGQGKARIGQAVSVELSGPPLAPASLFVAPGLSYLRLAPGCALYLDIPQFLAAVPTNAAGSASVALNIPAVPSLVGKSAYFQWLVAKSGGPLLNSFELTQALEAFVGQ
jgi:ELWxxDGT repeat protein